MARLGAQQQAHRPRAVGERRGDSFETDLGHFVDRDRQHVRRQAVAETRERVDQRHAVRLVVQQHDRRLRAAGITIGGQQRPQLAHQRIRRRQRIGGGPGRANGRALSAARADIGIDGDMIASRRDRAGGTEIEAARAADDLRARMGAEIRAVRHVTRLVETADEIARLEHGLEHGCGIAGIGAQIAVTQVRCGEQWCTAGDVEHEVAAGHRPIACGRKAECAARRGSRLGVAVDRQFERTEIALGRTDGASHNGEIGHPRRWHVGGRPDQHRHVEMVLEQVARLDRLLVAAIDQDHAIAGQVDEGKLGRGLGSRRQQGGHLGTRGRPVLRPAGGLADIGVCHGCVTGDFREQRHFLGAAHDKRPSALGRGAEFLQLGPAELMRGQNLGAPAAPLHGRGVERHRVFARADQNLWWPIGHLVSDLQGRTRRVSRSSRAGLTRGIHPPRKDRVRERR